MTMDWGDTVALLLLISPLIIVVLALVIGAITLAFGAGAGILAGIMNLITRPIQSILWVVKWLLLIAASFAALWGFIWLFFPEHRLHGGLILAGAVLAGFTSASCEVGRDWLKQKAIERAQHRQVRRELKQAARQYEDTVE